MTATAKALPLLSARPPAPLRAPPARTTPRRRRPRHQPVDIGTDRRRPGRTEEDRASAATRGGGTGGSSWESWEGRRLERCCRFGSGERNKRAGCGIGQSQTGVLVITKGLFSFHVLRQTMFRSSLFSAFCCQRESHVVLRTKYTWRSIDIVFKPRASDNKVVQSCRDLRAAQVPAAQAVGGSTPRRKRAVVGQASPGWWRGGGRGQDSCRGNERCESMGHIRPGMGGA